MSRDFLFKVSIVVSGKFLISYTFSSFISAIDAIDFKNQRDGMGKLEC